MSTLRADNSKALLLLVGFPLGVGIKVVLQRLVFEPYPRDAWGSWLCVGWAATVALLSIQFAIGSFAHAKLLGQSFLTMGLNAILYALVLLYDISLVLPQRPTSSPAGFLLRHFQEHIRPIYACTFLLALLPFIIARKAFGDKLKSIPQGCRIVWMACTAAGFFVPASHLGVHQVLWLIGFPLVIVLLAIYTKPYRSLPNGVQPQSRPRRSYRESILSTKRIHT